MKEIKSTLGQVSTSYKTTIVGALGAIGAYLQTSDDSNMKLVGTILTAVSSFLLGAFAKDFNVSGFKKDVK